MMCIEVLVLRTALETKGISLRHECTCLEQKMQLNKEWSAFFHNISLINL